VQEVIQKSREFDIMPFDLIMQLPLHFLVTDSSGATASIEFIKGRMVVHRGQDLPRKVLTNDSYDKSIEFFNKQYKKDNKHNLISEKGSLQRFYNAAILVDRFSTLKKKVTPVDYSLEMLRKLGQGDITVWTIVSDATERKIYYSAKGNRRVRVIELDKVDFSSKKDITFLPIKNKFAGNVMDKFEVITLPENKSFVKYCVTGNGLDVKAFPINVMVDILATYPSRFTIISKE
jgi:choloylglycine hydrolase